MAEARIFSHGPLTELATNVWMVRGSLPFPLHRNMIVLRLGDGSLLLHSPVALDENGMKALDSLGKVGIVIVPSLSHKMDAPFYKARYPEARVICAAAIRDLISQTVEVSGTVEDVLPALGFRLHNVPGLKIVEYGYECALPSGGRMLMFNDAFGGEHAHVDSLLGRILVRPLGSIGRFGVANIVRWRQVKDLSAVQAFARKLAVIPDLRLITVSHGNPVTERTAEALLGVA